MAEACRFLRCPTPDAWFETAERQLPTLLIDHAHCEKKAAGTAVSLIYRYVDKPDLLQRLSRLAREELRHFEQVIRMLDDLGIPYAHLTPSRYAGSMRTLMRTSEPGRLIDVLIVGAVVEARSCERFSGLAGRLDGPLAEFYRRLVEAEARHFGNYLALARRYADDGLGATLEERIAVFLDRDRDLVLTADPQFRFHSGLPVQTECGRGGA
jgi:tRNA 2-(methylsulfanyl)-N6-isopentenyladenosine37 hydroxylase